MTKADVARAIRTLQAADQAVSIRNLRKVLGKGSLRDLVKWRAVLMPQQAALPAPEAAVPAEAVPQTPAGAIGRPGDLTPPVPVPVEKPRCQCWRCGHHWWYELTPGRYVCSLCGVEPAT